ncbi:O-acetylserine/cysteine efflux transporter [Bradyrhizobium diazoefficiens]
MKPADILIALLVAIIWGLAFVASRIALDEFSPELMTAMRFIIAAVPCLFIPKPKVAWSLLIAISFTLFLGQFLSQAYGIAHGVPVGLTSVVVQSQALFTIGFAAIAFGERPTQVQTLGIVIAAAGLLMICGTVGYDFSVAAFAVLMISPISFAIGNLLLRGARGVPMFDLFAWLCVASAVPLFVLALIANGPASTWTSLMHMSLTSALCMLMLGGISTQHRLLAVGPPLARLSRGPSGAIRAAGAVRRLRRLQHRIRRTVRPAAPRRHADRDRRNRRDGAGEASANPAEDGVR